MSTNTICNGDFAEGAIACAKDAVLDDEEAGGDLQEKDLVRLKEKNQERNLEVKIELQFTILKVISSEALLEAKGCVDVMSMIKKGEIEDRIFAINGGHNEIIGVIARLVTLLLVATIGVAMVELERRSCSLAFY